MTTKQQEREALDKIKAIVDGLGTDSYISMAFAGCVEVASDNIENDFGDSWKARAESARRDAEKAAQDLAAAKAKIKNLESGLESALKRNADLRQENKRPADAHTVKWNDYETLRSVVSDHLNSLQGHMNRVAYRLASTDQHSDKIPSFQAEYQRILNCWELLRSAASALESLKPNK